MKRIVIMLLIGICLPIYMISCICHNNQYLKTFETVWKKMNKGYYDPAEDAYKGPLVLLIDQLSGSACELFAACLQAEGRAVIIGEQSPGAVMESDMKVFLNGSILMYPVAQPVTPDRTVLEGHGVVPDIEIGLDREMLLKGVDPQIDAAISYLTDRNISKTIL